MCVQVNVGQTPSGQNPLRQNPLIIGIFPSDTTRVDSGRITIIQLNLACCMHDYNILCMYIYNYRNV